MSESAALVAPARLGDLDRRELADALRPLWEDAGPLVTVLYGRSFPSWEAAIDAAETEIAAMSEEQRVALLGSHPRIGEDPRRLAARSLISLQEQSSGGSPATRAALAELNDRYESRFGFPFVEWVNGRPPEAMVEVVAARLERERQVELDAGCAALVAIARDRLGRASVKGL